MEDPGPKTNGAPAVAEGGKRPGLRVAAIALAVVAAFDFVVAIIPMPEPRSSETIYIPGGGMMRVERDYSSTEVTIIDTKHWVQICLNPVGWVAVLMGYGPDTLYLLRRPGVWRNALDAGQWLTLAALGFVSVLLWAKSAGRIEEQA